MSNADDLFYGPRLKIERADHHINDLETAFRTFVSSNMQRMRRNKNHPPLEGSIFPKHTPTILGDAIHNLRGALDHAYCIAAEANGVTINGWVLFPFRKDRESLEDLIKGHEKQRLTPAPTILDIILNTIQPYEGGAMGLFGLHMLDITDKHHVIIPTVGNLIIRDKLELLNERGEKTGYTFSGFTIQTKHDHKAGATETFFGRGIGGAILHGNPKDAFQITFQKGQPFEGESILKTIKTLRSATVEAINIIRKAC